MGDMSGIFLFSFGSRIDGWIFWEEVFIGSFLVLCRLYLGKRICYTFLFIYVSREGGPVLVCT